MGLFGVITFFVVIFYSACKWDRLYKELRKSGETETTCMSREESVVAVNKARGSAGKRIDLFAIIREADYRAVFIVGAVWLASGAICLPFGLGAPFPSSLGVLFVAVFSVGLLLFLTGLVNREKWKEPGGPSTHTMMILVAFLLGIAFIVSLLGYLQTQQALER